MLAIWDAGQGRSAARRALVLLEASMPDQPAETLAALPVGVRDAELLTLHETLFGTAIDCWLTCPACGATVDVAFYTDDVRIASSPVAVVEVDVGDIRIRARLPDSTDLLAIERETKQPDAERRLFERCVVEATRNDTPISPASLPDAAIAAVGSALATADPQAEILLDLACPDCAVTTVAPFDIVAQIWARLDHWARAMLTAIDAIATRYGWSEAAILALSPRRRQTYLDLIAEARR